MAVPESEMPSFPGFPDFKANVTFVPIQFFTVVVPHCSRGTVRIVGYALRKVLGWVDENGNPTREQLQFTYRELIDFAGVSRDCIAESLQEAIAGHFLQCIQPPSPDRSGQPAQSGIYELCWDLDGPWTDSPSEFRGFYYPEAATVEVQDGTRTVQRSKAARKNIPNAFFDYLLRRERLSVIRVVSALLFYSIQWGPGGERKLPVTKSITELSRLTKMSRQHVHQAVTEACECGYIEQKDAGRFDPAAGRQSRAATYAIRWLRAHASQPVRKGERETNQSEKVNGAPVEKGERTQSEKVNVERSELMNGLSIKKDFKKKQSTTEPIAADAAIALLRSEGFDSKTAKHLATRHDQAAIERQIQWLSHRNVTRSRLGLLRRAIEEDWPKPETAGPAEGGVALARQFASHYYAGYHDLEGDAGTEPFPKDIETAAKFVHRLLAQERDEAMIPQWGRRFGRMLREKHQSDAKAKPNLSFALVLYGDKFLRVLQQEATTRKTKALGAAREAHQRAFRLAYISYLRDTEIHMQQANAALYETFVKHRQAVRRLMTGGPFLASAERLARLENEESRLLDFASFFKTDRQKPVLDFWEWDARLNPARFGKPANPGNSSEARP